MFKFVGAVLILCATTYWGLSKSNYILLKQKQLSDCVMLINLIIDELSFTTNSTENIFEKISGNCTIQSTNLFTVYEQLPQRPLPVKWEEAVKNSNLQLNDKDTKEVTDIGKVIGSVTSKEQINKLSYIKNSLINSLNQITEYNKTHCKMYKCLGFLCGAVIVIIII